MDENDFIKNYPQLEYMMEKHGIDKRRFVAGIIFAEMIVNGETQTNAYMYAFGTDKDKARQNASRFRLAQWVQELILFFKPDDKTLYFGETRQIIRKLMFIIDDWNAENKDKIAAANALAKYIKAPVKKEESDEKNVSDAQQMIAGLMDGILKLSNSDKMINKHGEIIDVPVLK